MKGRNERQCVAFLGMGQPTKMGRASEEGASRVRGAAFGLAAALLFGASAPLAKLLVPHMGAILLQ